MDQLTEQRAKERQHAFQAIDWLERAIFAIEKADYPASDYAIGVARIHLNEAGGLENVRHEPNPAQDNAR